ncbi:hypothetical protein G6F45_013885 [Rhizopus arrhizus]|nr:hypothetical protein G6F45_013885 [Rhizopus arrhizus]
MDVEQTFGSAGLLEALRAALNAFPAIERIAARLALRSVRPRELASLRDALESLPALRDLVEPMADSPRLVRRSPPWLSATAACWPPGSMRNWTNCAAWRPTAATS